ncbi:MAG TPA: nucleotidyltransferase family protein [Thermoanaerobaculia bacterium]|nr:nucleotidyltransferase family protein [Thermoanaerobaculia bacterium]
MPAAVLPAAGASRRMGRPKLLLPYGEETVIGAVVAALRGGGVDEVVVVIDPDDKGLAEWSSTAGVGFTLNPSPERGMLSSILAGVEALGGAAGLAGRGPLVVCPADLPALRAATVAHLLARQAESGAGLVEPVFRGRRGHPLLIATPLVAEIATLDLEVGLRQLRERHPADLLEVDVDDPGVVADVDTPEDYQRLGRVR